MGRKEDRRKWYLKHREEQIARTRAYQAEHPEVNRKAGLTYYYAHREERLDLARQRDKMTIKHNGKVILRNVKKPPKPMLCTLCGRKSHLIYHHWQDDAPEIGLWICNRCHAAIHRMIKIGILKASIESQKLVSSGLKQ